MTKNKLQKFGREIFEVCRKYNASIDESTVWFNDQPDKMFDFTIFGAWPVNSLEDEVRIFSKKLKEI